MDCCNLKPGPFRIIRCLPGRYVDDAGDLDAPAGMSYADWEAQRSEVQIPQWMEKILRIPGGAFCLLLILLPFTLVRNRHPVLECSPGEASDDGLMSIVKRARAPSACCSPCRPSQWDAAGIWYWATHPVKRVFMEFMSTVKCAGALLHPAAIRSQTPLQRCNCLQELQIEGLYCCRGGDASLGNAFRIGFCGVPAIPCGASVAAACSRHDHAAP